jgi:CRP-like cAMP-binding protein
MLMLDFKAFSLILLGMEERQKFGALAALMPVGMTRQYPKKRTILFQGEIPRSVLILQRGMVKVYGITSSGDQRTVTLLTAGDIFPMSWVSDKASVCLYYYEALTDCTVLAVSKEAYNQALATDIKLRDQVFHNYLSHYVAATMHVYALEHSHAQDKLVYILQYLVARFGEKQADGRHKIALRLSHQDIAEMVGITRETTAVELHRLKKKGYIDYQRFTYIVDVAKLVRAVGGDEFESVKV